MLPQKREQSPLRNLQRFSHGLFKDLNQAFRSTISGRVVRRSGKMNDGPLLAILFEFVRSKTRNIVSHNGVRIPKWEKSYSSRSIVAFVEIDCVG